MFTEMVLDDVSLIAFREAPLWAPRCSSPDRSTAPATRRPPASGLWRVASGHFDEFERVYDERYAAKYGFWRPIIRHAVQAYLKCGDLREGFARVRLVTA